jgi:hypothetical protein
METFCNLLDPEVADDTRWGAAASVLFVGLGRIAEVVGPHRPLRRKDLIEDGPFFRVYLRHPKTRKDKCQHLDPVPLEMPINAHIWLGRLIHHHNQMGRQPNNGVWTMSNGSALTSKAFLAEFRHKVGMGPEVKSDNSSFRSGGATHLASCGVPLDRIQVLGRWKTTTYEQYRRHRPQTLGQSGDGGPSGMPRV